MCSRWDCVPISGFTEATGPLKAGSSRNKDDLRNAGVDFLGENSVADRRNVNQLDSFVPDYAPEQIAVGREANLSRRFLFK